MTDSWSNRYQWTRSKVPIDPQKVITPDPSSSLRTEFWQTIGRIRRQAQPEDAGTGAAGWYRNAEQRDAAQDGGRHRGELRQHARHGRQDRRQRERPISTSATVCSMAVDASAARPKRCTSSAVRPSLTIPMNSNAPARIHWQTQTVILIGR